MRLKRILSYICKRFLLIRGNPKEIARGLAVGVFVGMSPFLGLHTVLSLGLASIFKANRMAALAANWLGNPLTLPFIYLAEFKVGQEILGTLRIFSFSLSGSWQGALSSGLNVLAATILGSFILGVPAALGTYLVFRDSIHLMRLERSLARIAR